MPSKNTTGPFYQVTSKLYIHLPPCFASKPTEGIQEQLNGFLMRYVPQVDGVVLAHSDLKLLENSGRIINDSPYCHFWVSVKLLIWRPRKGSVLSGTINLQSPDHIGLLLYGTFNASIPSEHIPKDKYEFNATSSHKKRKADTEGEADDGMNGFMNGEWVVKSTGESIGDEGVVEFEVTDLIRTNEMLTVVGSLKNVPVMTRRPSVMTPVLASLPKVQSTKALNPVEEDEDDDEEDSAQTGVKRSAEEAVSTSAASVSEDHHEAKRIKKEKSDKPEKKEKKEKKDKKEVKDEKKDKKEKKQKKKE